MRFLPGARHEHQSQRQPRAAPQLSCFPRCCVASRDTGRGNWALEPDTELLRELKPLFSSAVKSQAGAESKACHSLEPSLISASPKTITPQSHHCFPRKMEMLAHSEGFAPHIPALPLPNPVPKLRTLAQPSWNPLAPPEMQKPGPCPAPAALTPPNNLLTLIFAGVTVPTEQHPSAASPLAPTSIGDRGQAVSAATVSHVTRRAPHAPPNPAKADPTPAHRAQPWWSGRSQPFPSSSRPRCSGFVLRHRAPTAPQAPGQPAAPLMSPEKAAAAAGGGEVRGQCNIYSDVTFHFYEVGKRCRSRKRAARDVPAREAADTPSTT